MESFFTALRKFLDELPVGTLMALAAIVVVVIAYIQGTINITQAFEYLGWGAGSAAAVGFMRSHAGKGIK